MLELSQIIVGVRSTFACGIEWSNDTISVCHVSLMILLDWGYQFLALTSSKRSMSTHVLVGVMHELSSLAPSLILYTSINFHH